MNEAWGEAAKMLGERECEEEEKDPTRRFPKDKRAGEREKRKLIWSEATGIVPHVRHGKGHLSLQPFITHMQCRELGTSLAGEGAAGGTGTCQMGWGRRRCPVLDTLGLLTVEVQSANWRLYRRDRYRYSH